MPLNTLMKASLKPLIFAGLATLTTTLNAQTVVSKPVICDLTEKITAEVMGSNYKEKPIWAGTSTENNNSVFVILANEKTGTWTMLQTSEKWSCILGMGEKFTIDSLKSILGPKGNQK
jgi:hypothetical protein